MTVSLDDRHNLLVGHLGVEHCVDERDRQVGREETLAEFSTVEVNRAVHRRDDFPRLGILSRLGPVNHDHIFLRFQDVGGSVRRGEERLAALEKATRSRPRQLTDLQAFEALKPRSANSPAKNDVSGARRRGDRREGGPPAPLHSRP